MEASCVTHIGICVRDMDKSLTFYRDALGMRVLGDRPTDPTEGGRQHNYAQSRQDPPLGQPGLRRRGHPDADPDQPSGGAARRGAHPAGPGGHHPPVLWRRGREEPGGRTGCKGVQSRRADGVLRRRRGRHSEHLLPRPGRNTGAIQPSVGRVESRPVIPAQSFPAGKGNHKGCPCIVRMDSRLTRE